MATHRNVATSFSFLFLVLVLSSLAGFASSARGESPSIPPRRSPSQFLETQPISAATTLLDVTITDEGLFPPVLTIPPGATIRWTNQTSQTQQLEGAAFNTGPGTQTLFLPLILKDNHHQGNGAVGPNLTPHSNPTSQDIHWLSGDILPGGSFSRTFDQPGEYPYHLAGSPTLTGSILIPQSTLLVDSTVLTVTTTSDDKTVNGNCTLREAIIAANTNAAVDACPAGGQADLIILADDTYNLTIQGSNENAAASGDLDIKRDITISGTGETIIDAENLADRIFHVHDHGKLTLSGLTLSNGQGFGGGIYNRGTLILNQSTINGSVGGNNIGGGFKNDGYATLNSSTISHNTADFAAGIYNRGILTLNNSTVSGNTANNQGGGIKNEGTLTLDHTTVTSNTAQYAGGIRRHYGSVNFKNSIIAGNTALQEPQHHDCDNIQSGSLGFNLVGDNTGCPTLDSDVIVNPADVFTTVLGPLQDNGGPTATHALLAGSPALDAVPLDKCSFAADQRGVARPQGAACDIGSFELEEPGDPAQTGPIFTVNTATDPGDGICSVAHCSLREAINAANARLNDSTPDEIHFNLPTVQPIQPLTPLPVISDSLKIDGTTQPGFVTIPLIILDGSLAGESVNGLAINTSNSLVRGLVIRNFSGAGVHVTNGAGNAILSNSIFDNGQLGIDLDGDDLTFNDIGNGLIGFDPDLGANNLQNFPVLIRAFPNGGNTGIQGRLNSAANTIFTLEFFANSTCDPLGFGEGQTFLGSTSVTTDENGNAVFADLSFPVALPEGEFITATATDPNQNTSEFSQCLPVSQINDSWPTALRLNLSGNPLSASADQFLDRQGQSRWYKFTVQPNSKVIVTLTNLPANYDLTIYKDIAAAFDELNSPQDLVRLSAEFAPDAFATDAFAPPSRSPDVFAPDAFAAEAFAPDAFAADAFAPPSRSPDAFAPPSRSPDAFAPPSRSVDAFTPDTFSPDAFAPPSRSPDGFPAEAYSSAQLRSLLGISAFEGTTSEGIMVNTWNNTGDFYIRVRGRDGAFSLAQPFHLEVTLLTGTCNAVSSNLPAPSLNATAGNFKTIILTDLGRMAGDPNLSALQTKLNSLAARPEVKGVVVNVAADARVAAANSQADANVACPYAKNLVAGAIKEIVDRYRAVNPLAYVVIVGNDNVIPFFRYPDNSLLGNEMDYIPPVLDFTASQASLRLGYVLTQDAYGSQVDVSLKVNEFPIPDLAVGRLVEKAADINTVLDAYLGTSAGVVPTPTSILVTGYDFLEDAARAVETELEAGVGVAADTLIADGNLSPQDPAAWTAADLKAVLLGSRHDLTFLAGHFSANSALAADYSSRLVTTELVASPVNFTNAIIFSAGCHSGYNIVNEHGIPTITLEPDWAQAFAQKGATLIAGTGYQYGDTDFIEYSERIYLEFSRQLRLGSGPVSIGQALVASKQRYLAETPQIRGLHEKSLLEAAIFGLPMLSVNMPGQRLGPDSSTSMVGGTNGFATNPGATLGLRYADVNLTPSLTGKTVQLTSVDGNSTVQAFYLEGADGVATHPLEPALPLALHNVSVSGQVLRGVGFTGGTYTDVPNIFPLTGAATTEIRGVHPTFQSDIFYPIQPWSVNYFDALANGGATRLAIMPAQHQSSTPGSSTSTLRRFDKLNFRLYYSNNITAFGDEGAPNIPALSSAPAIIGVTTELDEAGIIFKINVVGDPAAGIQEVWVTYTATSGPLAGKWQSLDLTQNSEDSTLWTSTFDPGATPLEDIRYIVQAVNGVGLVSLATNMGAYYIPGVDLINLQATALKLETPASLTGPYGTQASFSAVLKSESGTPLPGRLVTFNLGPLSGQGITNGSGRATATLRLIGLPGSYKVTAFFGGTTEDAPAAAPEEFTFTITKQNTGLSLNPAPATGFPDDDNLMLATLTDAAGRNLREQTIFFVVSGSGGTFRVALITDYAGRATLGDVPLPPGTYTVTAYFNGTIPLGGSQSIVLSSDYYHPSTATGTLTLKQKAPPVAVNDAYSVNKGQTLSVAAPGVLGNDSLGDGLSLTAILVDGPANGSLTLNANGSFSYTPNLAFTGIVTFTYKANNGNLDSNVATVTVTVIPTSLDCSTANPSPAFIWQPNKKFQPVTIQGLGTNVSITIVSIFQDEPVGKKPHSPDGQGIGTATAQVRAERDGTGDGRVYHISFTADDKNGGFCSGKVRVAVPHSQGGPVDLDAIDGGPLYDSTKK